jgi:Icc-related predicted phosphoesterase
MNTAVVADLHGLQPRFEKARKLIDEGFKRFLIAGDIAPMGYPEAQRANVKQNFEFLLHGRKDVEIWAIPGNDDWKIVEKTLKEFSEVTIPTDIAYPLDDGFSIVGYPYVPITPFNMKDYEKWDSPDYPELPADPAGLKEALIEFRINLEGLKSEGFELVDFRFDPQDRTDNIEQDLGRIERLRDPAKTVYLFHSPPYFENEPLRIGSRSITEFIKTNNPLITIHGHSHTAVERMKGKFVFDIGDTKSVLVGAGNDPYVLNFVTLDLKARSMERCRI